MKNKIIYPLVISFINIAYSQNKEIDVSNQFINIDFIMDIDSSFFNVRKNQFIYNTNNQSFFLSAFIANQKIEAAKKHLNKSEGEIIEFKDYVYKNHNITFQKNIVIKNDKKIYNLQYILKLNHFQTFFLTGTTVIDDNKFNLALKYSLDSFIENYDW